MKWIKRQRVVIHTDTGSGRLSLADRKKVKRERKTERDRERERNRDRDRDRNRERKTSVLEPKRHKWCPKRPAQVWKPCVDSEIRH